MVIDRQRHGRRLLRRCRGGLVGVSQAVTGLLVVAAFYGLIAGLRAQP